MLLLRLIRREIQRSLFKLVAMAVLAGLSNALILAIINAGAQDAATGNVSLRSAAIFIISLLIYITAQKYIYTTTTMEIEAAIHRMRLRLMDEIRHSELVPLEAIGRSVIVAAVTKETATLTQAATILIYGAQSTVLIFFTAIYIAYLSLPAFIVSTAIMGVAASVYLARARRIKAEMRDAIAWENRLFERLTDLLSGFKEVRLNAARSEDLYQDIVEISTVAAELKIRSQTESLKQFIFSQSSFYILLGAIVFAVPSVSETLGTSMLKTTTALLFIIGSISSVIQSIPMLSTANIAAESIERLEAALLSARGREAPAAPVRTGRFDRVELRDVRFRHIDKSSEAVFEVGPVDFVLEPGDTVFITGGNGSGKSTFLKVLTGLYQPDSGEITLDGVRVTAANRHEYRELFSTVFSDYHLFRRLYGVAGPEPAEVDRLLDRFQLKNKLHVVDGEFSTLDLSGGQRKRLALLVALLEERPILVLDEWTADQDPEFRRKFYEELVPAIKKTGATLVAVTHDDRHLDELRTPVRRLRMADGRFVRQHALEESR